MPSDMSDSDVLGRSAVYYAFVKRVFTEDGKGTLNRLASILKAHSNWTVDVIGHCDNDEVAEGKINPRFAEQEGNGLSKSKDTWFLKGCQRGN